MKIIIIEDELFTAEDLAETIVKVQPDAEIVATLSSVQEGKAYFSKSVSADLIFSDIQLGDGQSFEIFDKIKLQIPIIFCTAYDEFALEAFKTYGIDYILKPFSKNTVKEAIAKYKNLKGTYVIGQLEAVIQSASRIQKINSVLVHYRDQILPIAVTEIALIFIKDDIAHLMTFEGKSYFLTKTLDELESKLGDQFFRANRQYLVSRRAIRAVENYGARKLALLLNVNHYETITISKEKSSTLLHWLEEQ